MFNFGTTTATIDCTASPCSYLDQIGSAVTSVTRTSTGAYTVNFARTYTKAKCMFSTYSNGSNRQTANNSSMMCASCSSLSVSIEQSPGGIGALDSHGVVSCQGSY